MMYLNIIILILVTIVTFTLTTSYSEATENIEDLIEKGIELAEIEQYEEALSYLDSVLETEPNNLRGLNAMAAILGKLEQYEEALSYIDKVLEQDPDNLLALYSKGVTFVKLEQYENALSYFNKILEIEPTNILVLHNKISILEKLGKNDELISYLDRGLELNPDNVGYLNKKGVLHSELDQFEEAISSFDRALSLEPHNKEVQLNWITAFTNLPTDKIEGYATIQVRDSNERLVAYINADNVKVVRHTTSDDILEKLNFKEVITRDGQDFNVLETREKVIILEDSYLFRIGIHQIVNERLFVSIFVIDMNGTFLQKGDLFIVLEFF